MSSQKLQKSQLHQKRVLKMP